MMKQRKQFETWVMACYSAHYVAARNKSGKYVDERMQLMWSAWVAATIKAELRARSIEHER
jgi:hypothetical protein